MSAAAHHDHHAAEVAIEAWGRELPEGPRVAEAERRPPGSPARRRQTKAVFVVAAVAVGAIFGHASRWGLEPLAGSELWPAWIGIGVPLALILLAHVARIVLLPGPAQGEDVTHDD
ncbi:MAG: hypothetical protein AB7T63_08395 [Planctomycetota bacterium]